MTVAQVLITTDDGNEYRTFYFNENNVDAIYVIDSESMGVVIHGADFIMRLTQIYSSVLKRL